MVNGAIEPSMRQWRGLIKLGSVAVQGQFEVFNSSSRWGFLFGKLLLQLFNAVHDYDTDTVTVRDPIMKVTTVLHNQLHLPVAEAAGKQGISLTLDVKQWGDVLWGSSAMKPPVKQVPTSIHDISDLVGDAPNKLVADKHINTSSREGEWYDEGIDEIGTKIAASVLQAEEDRQNRNEDLLGGEAKPPPRDWNANEEPVALCRQWRCSS